MNRKLLLKEIEEFRDFYCEIYDLGSLFWEHSIESFDKVFLLYKILKTLEIMDSRLEELERKSVFRKGK